MIENDYIITQIELYFLSKKTEKSQIERLNEEELMKNENYANLRYELKACVFDLQKAKYLNEEKLISELTEKENELKLKLDKLKKEIKIPLRKYKPSCKICNDTGYIDNKHCNCFYENMNNFAYEVLEIYKPTLFSFEENSNKTENYNLVCKIQNYTKKKCTEDFTNLIFIGERGTGKTFTAQAVADYFNKNFLNALYINSFQLNDIYFKMYKSSFSDRLICEDILTKSDLLVIDDLGAENIVKGITAENLLMIISQRLTYHKPFIITTNLTPDEISQKYGERVFSRMFGKPTRKVMFRGKDQRLNN